MYLDIGSTLHLIIKCYSKNYHVNEYEQIKEIIKFLECEDNLLVNLVSDNEINKKNAVKTICSALGKSNEAYQLKNIDVVRNSFHDSLRNLWLLMIDHPNIFEDFELLNSITKYPIEIIIGHSYIVPYHAVKYANIPALKFIFEIMEENEYDFSSKSKKLFGYLSEIESPNKCGEMLDFILSKYDYKDSFKDTLYSPLSAIYLRGSNFMHICVKLIDVGASINLVDKHNLYGLFDLLVRSNRYEECDELLNFREKYEEFLSIDTSKTPDSCKPNFDHVFNDGKTIFDSLSREKYMIKMTDNIYQEYGIDCPIDKIIKTILNYVEKYEPEKLEYYKLKCSNINNYVYDNN